MTRTWNGRYAGHHAGTRNDVGYLVISVDGHRYKGHQLAWLYMTGVWPTHEIDHKNLMRMDNAFDNLRLATRNENAANVRVRAAVGYKGVYRSGRKFAATITVDGIQEHLGTYDTAELAHSAYTKRANEAFGKFARLD